VDCLELFRAGDREEYRAKLLELLADPARQQALSAGARRYAERFSWPRVAALTRDVYRAAYEVYSQGHHPQALPDSARR